MIDERTDLITNIKRKIHLFILKKKYKKKTHYNYFSKLHWWSYI